MSTAYQAQHPHIPFESREPSLKRILVQDGGATRGLIQASCLAELELRTGKKPCELFDMMLGSSVGSINAMILATGMSAVTYRDLMYVETTPMFKPRNRALPWNWLRPKFDRQLVMNTISKYVDIKTKLSDLQSILVATYWNTNEFRPGFVHSYDSAESDATLEEILPLVFAAPYFYGMVNWVRRRLTVTDAGVGDKNNPIQQALQECYRLGWLHGDRPERRVEIIGLGSGDTEGSVPYESSSKWGFLMQLAYSVRAGSSSGISAYDIDCVARQSRSYPNQIGFQFVSPYLAPGEADFGTTKYLDKFLAYGKRMASDVRI